MMHPDPCDTASEAEQHFLQNALAVRKKSLVPKGTCYNCDEPTEGITCSKECAEDFQRIQDARKRNGVHNS